MNKIWVQSSTELSKPQVVKVDVVPMSDLVDRVKMTISKYEMGAQRTGWSSHLACLLLNYINNHELSFCNMNLNLERKNKTFILRGYERSNTKLSSDFIHKMGITLRALFTLM